MHLRKDIVNQKMVDYAPELQQYSYGTYKHESDHLRKDIVDRKDGR